MQINTLIQVRHYHIVTIILVVGLFISLDSAIGEENSVSRLSTEEAQQLFKDMTNCDLPSRPFSSWQIPSDNLNVKGVSINKNKTVLLTKMKESFRQLYTEAFSYEGFPEVFARADYYYPIYILASTNDLTIVDSKLFITTDQNGRKWIPYNSIKKGCYVMYFSPAGIYLESKQGYALIQFKNPYTGETKDQLQKDIEAGISLLTDFKILPGEKSKFSIGFFNGNDIEFLFK